MAEKEDKRIRRTKKAVRAALLDLIQHKSVSQVTTTELCIEADINRSTFYAHWSSPEDVLAEIGRDFLDELSSLLDSGAEQGDVTLAFLKTIDSKRDMWKNIWNGNPELIQQGLDLCCEEGLAKLQGEDSSVLADEAFFLQLVTRGTTGVISSWIDSGCRMPPEELSDKINSFIDGGRAGMKQQGSRLV